MSQVRQRWAVLLVLLGAALAALAQEEGAGTEESVASSEAPTPGDESRSSTIVHLELDSIIHPVAEEIIGEALDEAARTNAQAVVIELATPGGLLPTTRNIASAFLASPTPVVVYVSPAGSQAASAGFFILMAADVAAMAPGTNTGAAHPVAGGGQDIPGDLGEKVVQDSAAWVRSLAAERGRDEELAQAAVTESRSFSADEALEAGLIDYVADDLDDLLEALDGLTIPKGEDEIVLASARARLEPIELTTFQRLRSAIVHPDVALALASIGSTALIIELWSPGAILPGVVGALCLILAGYSFSILPISWTGVALLLLAAILFALEIKIQSFGALTAGGVVSLVLGSLFLFRSPDPAIRVSVQMIVAMVVVSVGMVAVLMTTVVRVHRTQVATGIEGLVHERGVARTAIDPRGKVLVHGEIWNAVSQAAIPEGAEVEIESVDGMTLAIRRPESGSLPT